MTDKPVLFLLHALGSSARGWDAVSAFLSESFDVAAIDLPGYGEAPASGGNTVEAMADHVAAAVRARAPGRWMLVGHSMGGKIATVVAARALRGEAGLFGLRGVVLVAGSPPSPEPMKESRREEMLGWAADGPLDDAAARTFIKANTAAPLLPEHDARAVADLRRTDPVAWRAWLEHGSREEWREAVGELPLPALILAGAEDGDLGEKGQRNHNLPAYPHAVIEVVAEAAHLLPLEAPAEVAVRITRFWREEAGLGPDVPEDFARMLASDHVSARTRGILAHRALADSPRYAPQALTAAQLATLRAVAARVVPQEEGAIDLAARVDRQLAAGEGDGWRFEGMPPDARAYAAALDALAGFEALDPAAQDARLEAIAEGGWAPGAGGIVAGLLAAVHATTAPFTATQMKQWFEDARTDLVRQWLAHPATMARIGFTGYANGGDGERKQGFERLGAGEREDWEVLPDEASRVEFAR